MQISNQCTLWFTAMHHVMALTRSGRISAAQSTIDYLDAAGQDSDQAALACDLSRAAKAFYENRFAEALERMLDLRQSHGGLGASHAQQDLYDQIMVVAALKLGDLVRVRQLLKARWCTRVWDSGSWQAYPDRARPFDRVEGNDAIRTALRWM